MSEPNGGQANGNGASGSFPGGNFSLRGQFALFAASLLLAVGILAWAGWHVGHRAIDVGAQTSHQNTLMLLSAILAVGHSNMRDHKELIRSSYLSICTQQQSPEKRQMMATASSIEAQRPMCNWLPDVMKDEENHNLTNLQKMVNEILARGRKDPP